MSSLTNVHSGAIYNILQVGSVDSAYVKANIQRKILLHCKGEKELPEALIELITDYFWTNCSLNFSAIPKVVSSPVNPFLGLLFDERHIVKILFNYSDNNLGSVPNMNSSFCLKDAESVPVVCFKHKPQGEKMCDIRVVQMGAQDCYLSVPVPTKIEVSGIFSSLHFVQLINHREMNGVFSSKYDLAKVDTIKLKTDEILLDCELIGVIPESSDAPVARNVKEEGETFTEDTPHDAEPGADHPADTSDSLDADLESVQMKSHESNSSHISDSSTSTKGKSSSDFKSQEDDESEPGS